jgi:hypothetical protein
MTQTLLRFVSCAYSADVRSADDLPCHGVQASRPSHRMFSNCSSQIRMAGGLMREGQVRETIWLQTKPQGV